MGLMTQIDLLQELKVQQEFNRAAGQIGELLKRGEASLNPCYCTHWLILFRRQLLRKLRDSKYRLT